MHFLGVKEECRVGCSEYEVMLMGSGCLPQTLLDGGWWVSSWYHHQWQMFASGNLFRTFKGTFFFILSGMKWLENWDNNTLKPDWVEMFWHFSHRWASKMRHPFISNAEIFFLFFLKKSFSCSVLFPFSSYISWYVYRCWIDRLLPKLTRRVENTNFLSSLENKPASYSP